MGGVRVSRGGWTCAEVSLVGDGDLEPLLLELMVMLMLGFLTKP